MKYKAVEDDIRKKIINGEYQIGEQLESEEKLCAEYGVSQLTLNRAITQLAEKGYVKRIKGKGTFVKATVSNESKKMIVHTGLGEDITSRGMKPGVFLVDYRIISAKDYPKIRKILDVGPNEMLHYFIRVRTGDDVPLVYSVYYMPVSQIPSLDINVLNTGSVWSYLAETGLSGVTNETFEIHICKAKGKMASYLQVEEGHLLLNTKQTNALENRKPYSYIETYIVPDRFTYVYNTVQVLR